MILALTNDCVVLSFINSWVIYIHKSQRTPRLTKTPNKGGLEKLKWF